VGPVTLRPLWTPFESEPKCYSQVFH
jgi:hypothetical protein